MTEEVTIRDTAGSRGQLERLREIGVAVAVDDFGTGYSSLTHLVTLPIDVIKVDRSFIAGLVHDPQRRSVIAALGSKDEYEWSDDAWLQKRAAKQRLDQPMSVYEVHLGSWRRRADGSATPLHRSS